MSFSLKLHVFGIITAGLNLRAWVVNGNCASNSIPCFSFQLPRISKLEASPCFLRVLRSIGESTSYSFFHSGQWGAGKPGQLLIEDYASATAEL